MAVLFFILLVLTSHLILTALRRALLGRRDRKAEIKREADHQRYLVFRRQRAADRNLIQEQVAEQSRALERGREAQQQAREARRRLVPDWDQVGLLVKQERISREEYRAYCFDNTGEYCPTLLAEAK